jgi:hypothetical protein
MTFGPKSPSNPNPWGDVRVQTSAYLCSNEGHLGVTLVHMAFTSEKSCTAYSSKY